MHGKGNEFKSSLLVFFLGVCLIFLTFFTFNLFIKKKKVVKEEIIQPSELLSAFYFAQVAGGNLYLAYPVDLSQVILVGLHEAENPKTLSLIPLEKALIETTETIRKLIRKRKSPLVAILNTRDRNQVPTSAADIGVKRGTKILSPVDGRVTKVKFYSLYGRIPDYHIEIEPKENPHLRVVLIHLKDIEVKEGDLVKKQKTIIGKVRPLSDKINPQINRYIPFPCEHIHIQVNPVEESK